MHDAISDNTCVNSIPLRPNIAFPINKIGIKHSPCLVEDNKVAVHELECHVTYSTNWYYRHSYTLCSQT